jgi:hypothetical protein
MQSQQIPTVVQNGHDEKMEEELSMIRFGNVVNDIMKCVHCGGVGGNPHVCVKCGSISCKEHVKLRCIICGSDCPKVECKGMSELTEIASDNRAQCKRTSPIHKDVLHSVYKEIVAMAKYCRRNVGDGYMRIFIGEFDGARSIVESMQKTHGLTVSYMNQTVLLKCDSSLDSIVDAEAVSPRDYGLRVLYFTSNALLQKHQV